VAKEDELKSQIKVVDELYGPPQASEYDSWSPEKVAQYDSALREFEGAQAYVKGGTFYGQKFAPLAKVVAEKYARMNPDARDKSLNELARFRAWKQGQPVEVYGPPAPEFSDARMPGGLAENDTEKTQAAATAAKTPEQKKALSDTLSQQNKVLGQLGYFAPVRDWLESGRRQLSEYEMSKVGIPADQVERIKKQRAK
jgi:hypothetical protein